MSYKEDPQKLKRKSFPFSPTISLKNPTTEFAKKWGSKAMDIAGKMKESDTGKSSLNLATKASNYATNKMNKLADEIDPAKKDLQETLRRLPSDTRMDIFNKNPERVVSSAHEYDHKQTVDQCCETFRAIIRMCEDQIEKCTKSGCCSQTTRYGGNKKSIKNTKRKNKVKSVKKKRSSQSGGKVHPWREHIKKTRLANPGVKDFGQIIQMAKKTYKN